MLSLRLLRLSRRVTRSGHVRHSSSHVEAFLSGSTASYVDEMYTAWLKDPKSVHVSWQAYFKNMEGSPKPFTAPPTLIPSTSVDFSQVSPAGAESLIPSGEILDHMKVQLMVRAFQVRGHQLARIDPLDINVRTEKDAPELTIQHYGFTEADLDRKFFLGSGILPGFLSSNGEKQLTLRQIRESLLKIYCIFADSFD
jgi:2-oxoglutarate dehydrogenase E1 component